MWRSSCFGLLVSVSTSTFSRQDSNRCALDLVTGSLFYPLLTDFISFPSLPRLCAPRPLELFKSSFFLFRGAGGLFCVPCRASAVQHVFTTSRCSLDKHVAARNQTATRAGGSTAAADEINQPTTPCSSKPHNSETKKGED